MAVVGTGTDGRGRAPEIESLCRYLLRGTPGEEQTLTADPGKWTGTGTIT